MSAFGRLVRKYQDRVFNTCWRICGDQENAADLAQEAFVKALESIGKFERKSSFYTWLFRIAVNLAISDRRKQKRSIRLSLESPDGGSRLEHQAVKLVARMGSADRDDPPEQAASREVAGIVARTLDELDEEHRTVLVLKDMESLDYKQISQILRVPLGTVKSRIHRARMALRDRLLPVLGDPTDVDRI